MKDTHAENAPGRRDYQALECRHDAVARARDVAVAQCADEAEGRRSAETQSETEKRLRLGTAATLEEEHRQRLRVEVETRGAQAVLETKEELRRVEEARVASLAEEMHRFSLVTDRLKEERN